MTSESTPRVPAALVSSRDSARQYLQAVLMQVNCYLGEENYSLLCVQSTSQQYPAHLAPYSFILLIVWFLDAKMLPTNVT